MTRYPDLNERILIAANVLQVHDSKKDGFCTALETSGAPITYFVTTEGKEVKEGDRIIFYVYLPVSVVNFTANGYDLEVVGRDYQRHGD